MSEDYPDDDFEDNGAADWHRTMLAEYRHSGAGYGSGDGSMDFITFVRLYAEKERADALIEIADALRLMRQPLKQMAEAAERIAEHLRPMD